jgi:hypothetical protein
MISLGSFGGFWPAILAVLARPTIAGMPGRQCSIVPRVKRSNPLRPSATSIALHTVGVSTFCSTLINVTGILSIFLNFTFYEKLRLELFPHPETKKYEKVKLNILQE